MLYIFIGVLSVAVFTALSAKFRLYELEYNPKKISHNALIILFTGVCLFASWEIFRLLYQPALAYPFEKHLGNYNAYEQLFDALMKRQLNIDLTPAAELAEMDNPYDWGARSDMGFYYLWDRAYYNGNYYCYFGPAPILTVYFPFYFLTRKVPSAHTVCFIMSAVSVVIISLLTVKVQKLFLKKVNLILLLLSVLTVEAGSLVLMVQSSADMYYTAVQSGILFLALFLVTTLTAYEKKSVKAKCCFFAASGLSLVLLVLSRPNLALFFLMAIPVYLNALLSKKHSAKKKLFEVLSFAVPVLIGAVFVMWYNKARFDSIFEFGASYQLTVYDVRKYALSSALIMPTVYYYFTKPAEFSSAFPYLKLSYVNIIKDMNYSGYVYLTSTVGAFVMPCNWALPAVLPWSLCGVKKDRVKAGFFITGALSVAAVAFSDMCLGGVNIRYLADIMLVTTLLSVTVITDVFMGLSNKKAVKTICFSAATLILLASVALGALLVFNNERDYILIALNGV